MTFGVPRTFILLTVALLFMVAIACREQPPVQSSEEEPNISSDRPNHVESRASARADTAVVDQSDEKGEGAKVEQPTPHMKIEHRPAAKAKDKITTAENKKKVSPPQPKPKPKPQPRKLPKATFLSESYDFGFIDEGDTIRHTFTFVNEGQAPYEILRVDASCGCTLPLYPLDPIAPGRSGKIDVTYLSENKLGRQRVTIDILGNGPEKTQTLTMTGVVR